MADRTLTPDDATLREAAEVIRIHRQAALATLDETGAPYTAMVAYVAEPDLAGLLIHLSELSAHKGHLRRSSRASLLIFTPDDGKSEPLARPRLSLSCHATFLERGGELYGLARERYLERLPAHQMMFQLGDFDLVRLEPHAILFNAGFGRAYRLTPEHLAQAATLGDA